MVVRVGAPLNLPYERDGRIEDPVIMSRDSAVVPEAEPV